VLLADIDDPGAALRAYLVDATITAASAAKGGAP
jgi:hypothetical protein